MTHCYEIENVFYPYICLKSRVFLKQDKFIISVKITCYEYFPDVLAYLPYLSIISTLISGAII